MKLERKLPAEIAQCIGGSNSSNVESGNSFIALHAQRVERHRNQIVLADRKNQVEQLLCRKMTGQRFPGWIADECFGVQFVHRAEHCLIQFAPAFRVQRFFDSANFLVGQTGPSSNQHVLPPFVFAAAEPANSQNHQFTFARRQGGGGHDHHRTAGPPERRRPLR